MQTSRQGPAEGFTGRAPTFPLAEPSTAEKKLWRVLWKKPQAVMWDRHGLTFQVAHYCRSFLEASERGAPASLKTSVLRMEDSLGLSTVGLNALRWSITSDELGAKRAEPAATVERPAPVRRLRQAVGE